MLVRLRNAYVLTYLPNLVYYKILLHRANRQHVACSMQDLRFTVIGSLQNCTVTAHQPAGKLRKSRGKGQRLKDTDASNDDKLPRSNCRRSSPNRTKPNR